MYLMGVLDKNKGGKNSILRTFCKKKSQAGKIQQCNKALVTERQRLETFHKWKMKHDSGKEPPGKLPSF